jgi:hypothetical protein
MPQDGASIGTITLQGVTHKHYRGPLSVVHIVVPVISVGSV